MPRQATCQTDVLSWTMAVEQSRLDGRVKIAPLWCALIPLPDLNAPIDYCSLMRQRQAFEACGTRSVVYFPCATCCHTCLDVCRSADFSSLITMRPCERGCVTDAFTQGAIWERVLGPKFLGIDLQGGGINTAGMPRAQDISFATTHAPFLPNDIQVRFTPLNLPLCWIQTHVHI